MRRRKKGNALHCDCALHVGLEPTWLQPLLGLSYYLLTNGVCEKALLSCKPIPCSPTAETALQLLIWCSES